MLSFKLIMKQEILFLSLLKYQKVKIEFQTLLIESIMTSFGIQFLYLFLYEILLSDRIVVNNVKIKQKTSLIRVEFLRALILLCNISPFELDIFRLKITKLGTKVKEKIQNDWVNKRKSCVFEYFIFINDIENSCFIRVLKK